MLNNGGVWVVHFTEQIDSDVHEVPIYTNEGKLLRR